MKIKAVGCQTLKKSLKKTKKTCCFCIFLRHSEGCKKGTYGHIDGVNEPTRVGGFFGAVCQKKTQERIKMYSFLNDIFCSEQRPTIFALSRGLLHIGDY